MSDNNSKTKMVLDDHLDTPAEEVQGADAHVKKLGFNQEEGGVKLPVFEDDISTVVASPTLSEATVATEPFPYYDEEGNVAPVDHEETIPARQPREQVPYDAVVSTLKLPSSSSSCDDGS